MGRSLVLLFLSIPALLCPTAPAAETAREQGPVLAADTLTAAHRAELEAELNVIRERMRREGHDWLAGETSFLRLSREERDGRLLKRPWPAPLAGDPALYKLQGYDSEAKSLDWRDRGGRYVTPVRNQGDCAAGWNFAATACLESAFLISIGGGQIPDFDLSEQQILSCLGQQGLPGNCDGGWADDVLWLAQNVGVSEENCWAYQGDGSLPCVEVCEDAAARSFRLADYGFVSHEPDLAAIKDALHNYGPLATTLTVHQGFEAYTGGIYKASGPITGYHAVLIIGYDDKDRCFIGKNSWGTGWGEGGFFRIAYDSGCSFGSWTTYARFDGSDHGPFAALHVDRAEPKTGDRVLFEDRSIWSDAPLLSWDWDFDGDGEMDASGPGPHEFVFRRAGLVSPKLTVMDEQGRTDTVSLNPQLDVIWDGPVWLVDAGAGSVYGNGSPEKPFLNIQMALNAAADGDTIVLRPGIYRGSMNTSLMPGAKGLVLLGEGAPGTVVLDGEGESRLLVLDADGARPFEAINLHFTGGWDALRGGAVLIEVGAPRFVSCQFTDCGLGTDPEAAGAAIWSCASPLFEDCYFSDNRCEGEGGAVYSQEGSARFQVCAFEANSALSGGALSAVTGAVSLQHCYFAGNTSRDRGGALDLVDVEARIDAVLFRDNRTEGEEARMLGGAIATGGESRLSLRSSILAENWAEQGAALYIAGGSADLVHVTCWRNRAERSGGALAVADEVELHVVNSIFWEDEAPESPEIHAPEGSLYHCLVQGGHAGLNILDVDPRLVDPGRGDFQLAEGSPCLSAGLTEGYPAEDYEGYARPQPAATAPDLGACESPASSSPTSVAEDEPARLRFEGIYPNPFNSSTTFVFHLPSPASVRLLVIGPTGRLVGDLLDEFLGAGSHRVPWMAQDEDGQPLASGVFLVRVESLYEDGREEIEIRKAILVK